MNEEAAMEFFEALRSRRSVRAYEGRTVEEEKLASLLEAARLAPTAHDNQPFRLFVLGTEGRREELARVCKPAWFSEAPLLLAVCSVASEAWVRKDGRSYAWVDAAIVMDHLVLAATALGLGTCWVGAFNAAEAASLLGLEAGWEPVAFSPLGYPREFPDPRPRRPLAELVIRR
ncbi:MAG TPA: nitroreductase family protein [Spirochaetales bacterium]|nr:nitroreductase family protein [Spirochaetales bacterium]HRY55344.1 nitroreductase family protein [Spirochaetia bacterium]HRZ63437.1 nitroreductase family protein [Spirochaetia bacterium]